MGISDTSTKGTTYLVTNISTYTASTIKGVWVSMMIYIVLASNARTSHQGAESLNMPTRTLTGNQARHSKSLSQVDGSYVVEQLPDVDEDASYGFHEQCSF